MRGCDGADTGRKLDDKVDDLTAQYRGIGNHQREAMLLEPSVGARNVSTVKHVAVCSQPHYNRIGGQTDISRIFGQ
jgi:hypothetical protein